MKREKRIPTILGLLFLLTSIIAGIYLSSNKVNFRSKASGDCKPINVQPTNITDSSFVISFTTSADCMSSVSINNQAISNFNQSSKIHYFSVDNLVQSTDYRYSIVARGDIYEESSYLVKTAQKPSGEPPVSDIAWGKIYNPDKSPGAYSLVYLIIPEGSPLSALVTSNGNWNIPFANSYNFEKSGWFTPESNINEDIYVVSQDGQTTQIAGNTSRNNPVPDIIIGQNTFSIEPVDPLSIGSINYSEGNSSSGKIVILNPKNGETISTLRPDFFGTADPNYTLNISLSGPISVSGSPISDSTGTWHWSPTPNLTPGNYIIKAGTVEHNFVVLGDSGALAYTASGSGSINTPTPTEIPIYSLPTSTPIPTIISTPISTVIPTKIPTQRTYKPSTSSGVPTTGTSFPTVILGIMSISLLVFGFILI